MEEAFILVDRTSVEWKQNGLKLLYELNRERLQLNYARDETTWTVCGYYAVKSSKQHEEKPSYHRDDALYSGTLLLQAMGSSSLVGDALGEDPESPSKKTSRRRGTELSVANDGALHRMYRRCM